MSTTKAKRRLSHTEESAPDAKRPRLQDEGKDVLESRARELRAQRAELPIASGRAAILKSITDHQNVIVVGETGSGKTTQIPQFLYEAGFSKGRKKIGITQPRRVAAMTVAARVAEEMGTRLGDRVGYQVRFEDVTSPATAVKYMTDGILLREAVLDPLLSAYGVIILDEAHERTLNTDVLFGLLKGVQRRRPELKIVVMSATLEAEQFASFFGDAPVLYIQGRQFPVEIMYTLAPQNDYLDAALTAALQIHCEETEGDILVFLTGREEIEGLEKLLSERSKLCPPNVSKMLVCPIYAALPPSEQMKAFAPAPEGCRKIILATNIAETSVTINGVRFVVDCGFVKARGYDPRIGVESLVVLQTSKAQARQRTGRAGREAPGKAFRLYTEQTFDGLPDTTIPEIKRCNLASVVLQLKALGVADPLKFDFMDKPPRDAIGRSMEQLYALGALNDAGELTPLGRRMAEFPLEPVYAKILLVSEDFGCTEEALSIVAMLSVESIFYTPRNQREAAASARRNLSVKEGDHLTLLNVYNCYKSMRSAEDWCRQNFVNARSMKKAEAVRDQLRELCVAANIRLTTTTDNVTIRRCLVAGCFLQAAVLQPDGAYRTFDKNQLGKIHPSSILFAQKKAPAIIYNELVVTTKQYMRDVTSIDPSWLPELAPNYFEVDAEAAAGHEDDSRMKGVSRGANLLAERTRLQQARSTPTVKNPFNS